MSTKEAIGTPNFVRELSNHAEKAWDLTSQESVSNELWNSETKAFLDATTLKSLFFTEDWVFIIIDLIASKISSQPLEVMKRVMTKGQASYEQFPEHPLNQLIAQPNEWQDYSQWMYNTCVELFLMGNGIMWHAPRSGQLITLPTENVTMQFDSRGRLSQYSLMASNEESGMMDIATLDIFKSQEIAHVRRPNPNSLLYGLSPFIPGRKSILFNRYSQDYLNAFYLKQATPGLALSLDRTVNEDVALRQLRSFEVAYQGRKNQRRTLILPKGVEAKVLTHSLSDQRLIDHINQNRETICGLLKVPKHELSLQAAGSLGSEEYKIAIRNFWESTLKPGMRFIEGTLTKFFQMELGEDAFFEFNLSDVDALKSDLLKKAETATKMLQSGLSVNEVRQEIWEQEPSEIAGSNDPYVLVQQTPTIAPVNYAAPAPVDQKLLPSSRKIKITDSINEYRGIIQKQLDNEESRTISELGKGVIDILVGMTETAIDVITSSEKYMWRVDIKALPSKTILKRRIQKAIASDFEDIWTGMVAKTLKKTIDIGYDQMLTAVFNEEDKDTVETLRARDEEKRFLMLEARALEAFDMVSKTHTERILVEVATGVAKGESITDVMRRVANVLGTPGQLVGKAETIARTETLTAVSIGQGAAVDNAEEVIPGLQKVWLTAGDNRVRDSHEDLNGEVVGAKEKFGNGLRHPRDINSSDPSEVINCRCTLLMLPPGEELEIPK